MNKKRLIVSSIISIMLVAILLIGSTYSIFTTTEIDENTNVYTTGNLAITYTLSEENIVLTNNIPMTEEESDAVYPYRITVTNNGNVPYMFDVILNDTTSTDVIDYQYIMTKVGYLSPKPLSECTNKIIKEDIVVLAGDSVDIDVRVWLDDTLSNTEMGKSFYAKLSIDGLAVYNDNAQINNDILSLKYMKPLSTSDTQTSTNIYFRSDTYREYIKTASFVNYINTSNAIEVWDMSDSELNSENSVVAWIENNETKGYYDLYIGSNYEIYAKNLYNFLGNMESLENVSFDNLNTSLTIKMRAMFMGASNLTTLDLSSFNTSNVTDMRVLFSGCSNLTTLDLSGFDTSSVTDMTAMFHDCSSLTTLDLSSFDTRNVTTMTVMFQNCSNLMTLDLSSFDTGSVTDMTAMFSETNKLSTTLTIRNANTSYSSMFISAATATGSSITLNYTYLTSGLVDSMIATASSTSNVSKGKLVE